MYSISISEETDSMLKASVNILFLSVYVYNLTVCLNVNVAKYKIYFFKPR